MRPKNNSSGLCSEPSSSWSAVHILPPLLRSSHGGRPALDTRYHHLHNSGGSRDTTRLVHQHFPFFVSKRRKYCKIRNSETSSEARFHCHFTTDDCPLLKWRKKHKIQTWTRRPGKYKIISKKKIRKIRKKTKIRTHFPAGGVSGKD